MNLINVDFNFFSFPLYKGDLFITKDFFHYSHYRPKKWIEVDRFINKVGIEKSRKNFSVKNAADSLIEYSNYIKESTAFYHFGSHINIYSFEGNYDGKDHPSYYKNHNAFVYFIKNKKLKEINWVVPTYFVGETLAEHFKEIVYDKQGNKITVYIDEIVIPINIIYFDEFKPVENSIYGFVLNQHLSALDNDDEKKLLSFVY